MGVFSELPATECYQPIIEFWTNLPVGVEVLDPPPRGITAEELYCRDMGLLLRACRQAQKWSGIVDDLWVAVNVLASHLLHPGFLETVKVGLEESGLPPHRLVLEILEIEELTDDCLPVLVHLRKQGIGLAIDDAGAGFHTTLQQIKKIFEKYPNYFTEIKLAPVAWRDQPDSGLLGWIWLQSGLRVVAEGAETPHHSLHAGLMGWLIQGWNYTPKLPPAECEAWLSCQTTATGST